MPAFSPDYEPFHLHSVRSKSHRRHERFYSPTPLHSLDEGRERPRRPKFLDPDVAEYTSVFSVTPIELKLKLIDFKLPMKSRSQCDRRKVPEVTVYTDH